MILNSNESSPSTAKLFFYTKESQTHSQKHTNTQPETQKYTARNTQIHSQKHTNTHAFIKSTRNTQIHTNTHIGEHTNFMLQEGLLNESFNDMQKDIGYILINGNQYQDKPL